MSSTSKGRKSKISRPGSKKNLGQNQNPPYDGAYGNPRLVHVLLSLMGKKCQTKVRNSGVYDGIFHTFNPKMDISLNVVHKSKTGSDQSSSSNGIDARQDNDCPKEEELIEQMIFQSENLVSATFEDVDLDYAVLELNETNGESVNQQKAVKTGEKKLELWTGGGDSVETEARAIGSLEGPGVEGTNGWDANEMFRANEEKYGVVSDYDSSLASYTMPLDIKETEEDSERVARATRLAQEIEGSSDYKQRTDLELDDGTTEEMKFSAVQRDSRKDGRGPRDFRDREFKDAEYGGYRDKDRGDRDRDHPISPQGYRSKHDHDRFRSRGRGRDVWDKRNQQGYPGPNMGPSRNMGPGGPSGGRNQPPMSQIDGPSGKPYRGASSSHVPPRFTKSGSGGHSRDEERMRQQNENNSMHSQYAQAPKGQRQQRMTRNPGRWGPTSPSQEFGHHSPTQMHPDPAVISSGPPGGGPPLSRTSSSSSNTSAPVQNHRKHLSTSSQEEQPQHHPHHHQQHMRQKQSSSSPTGGPGIGNVQPPTQQRGQPMPLPLSTNSQSQQEPTPSPHTWANIASRKPGPEMPRSPSNRAQQSPRSTMPAILNVGANAKLIYTPKGSTPPAGNVQYSGQRQMGPQIPGGMGLTVHPSSPAMRTMTEHPAAMQGQMIAGASTNQHQQSVVTTTTQQQQQQQQQHVMQGQPGQRRPQTMKVPTGVAEPQKHQAEKTEDMKPVARKPAEALLAQQPSSVVKSRSDPSSSITELKEFRQNFKLSTDVMNKDQPSAAQTQPPNKPQPRPAQNLPQMAQAATRPYPAAQQYQQQQVPQQYITTMPHQEYNVAVPHPILGNTQIPSQAILQQQKQAVQHPGMVPQMHLNAPPISHQQMSQIPMAAPGIHNFASPQQGPSQVSPRAIDSQKIMGGRILPQMDKSGSPMQQKAVQSPKGDIQHHHHPNMHYVTGPHTSQANPSAVITVSAASPSPIVTSQYPATVIANSHVQHQQHPRQSPTMSQAAPVSSAPSIESAANVAPSSGSPSTSMASPPPAKPLNPEAMEFKPRTPANTAVIVTRATTPLQQQQGYVTTYQTPVMSGIGPPLLYPSNPGPQIEPMQAPINQMYPQFPQQFLVGQPGHMQQFATFDQNGQVYASPAHQPMMTQNPRMAVPGTPQQHMQQYTQEQSPATVYVPVPPQQAGYIQARPHSAHTPTQVTHVTAASPAGASTQQAPQPAMVPTHGAQQQMWMPTMMVPAGQIPQHVNQTPQIPQYINATQMSSNVAMTSAVPQAKGLQQGIPAGHYIAQPQPRPYYPPVANTQ